MDLYSRFSVSINRMSFDHHAYLVIGTSNAVRDGVIGRFAKERTISVVDNPDVVMEHYESLGIDDARHITALQSRRSVGGGTKIIVLQCEQLTLEAQNALLKTFEEPSSNTVLFLCVPSESSVIPTLRSRMILHEHEDVEDEDSASAAADFIDANPATRLIHIEELVESKSKTRAQHFVSALIHEYEQRGGVTKYHKELGVLTEAEQLLHERGGSIKLMLEHIAVVI